MLRAVASTLGHSSVSTITSRSGFTAPSAEPTTNGRSKGKYRRLSTSMWRRSAASRPVGVVVDNTTWHSGSNSRRAAMIGATAPTSPTEQAWNQTTGSSWLASSAAEAGTRPKRSPRPVRDLPLITIRHSRYRPIRGDSSASSRL